MPTSEEHVRGDNKEKTQKGSQKRPRKTEELANGPMKHKLDFELDAANKRQKTEHAIKTVLLDCPDYCKSSKIQALGHRLQPYVLRDHHSYCRKSKRISKSNGAGVELM
ncbi:uncharacterized protein WM294_015779 isoform 1-T1 [Sarcoramphus papa]